MENIRLRDMQCFLAVVKEQNISRAAEKLFIAQPTLSQLLKKIEQDFDAPLFVRVGNRLNLTPEGQCFADFCTRMLQGMHDVQNTITDISNLQTGAVTLGIPLHLTSAVAPELIRRYKTKFPGIRLILKEDISTRLETMLLNRETDLIIVPYAINDPRIAYSKIFDSEMLLMMSKKSPLNRFAFSGREKDGVTYFDLKILENEPFLATNPANRSYQITQEIFTRNGLSPKVIPTTRNIKTLAAMVANEYGVSLIPEYYIQNLPSVLNDVNVYHLPEGQNHTCNVVMGYHKNAYLPAAARKLMETVNEIYQIV